MKLNKLSILIFIFLNATNVNAQKEANIWYFGEKVGLNFNSGSPIVITNGQLFTDEGSASISDDNGNLLFYTDGSTVWNKNHNVMTNGTGLKGDYSSSQSAIIVPRPDYPNIYYIFTVDSEFGPDGLQYSEVDMNLDGGLGAITSNKNILLLTPTTEQITAIKSPSTNSYWVVSHKYLTNEFIAYKVSSIGVETTPVTSAIGDRVDDDFRGVIKISPNGKKLASATKINGRLGLFDFDTDTGTVSNLMNLEVNPYGLEFSPDSKILYASGWFEKELSQFNIDLNNEIDINNSRIVIRTDDYVDYLMGSLQLAPDGKIYMARHNNEYIDVINNPNVLGLGCNYEFEKLHLGGRICRLGLPPFIQSFFNLDAIAFENTCSGDITTFEIQDTVDSLVWDFGDPASGASNTSIDISPTHVFSAPGTYEVSVTATIGTGSATETTLVTIYEQPFVVQPSDIILCDYEGGNIFYLDSYSSSVLGTLDPSIFGVNYYEGMDDYVNGIKIPMPNAYVGSSNFFTQEIVAEVYNKQNPTCAYVTSFNVGIDRIPKLRPKGELANLTLCDDTVSGSDTDGTSIFDLTKHEGNLLAEPMANVAYFYYLDADLQQHIATPDAYRNIQNPQVIYVEGVNTDTGYCRDVSSFIIEVVELPIINSPVTLKQCDDDLDGFSAFNLNEVIPKITSNHAYQTFTFFTSQGDAQNNNNPITNPTTYINQTVSSDIVWARIENISGCFRISEVELVVTTTQIPSTFARDFYVCDDNGDGISSFDFSSVNDEITAMFPSGQQLLVAYYRNETDALAEVNAITDITSYRNIGYPNSQQIYIRVDSELNNDCLGLGAHINLFVEQRPMAHPVSIQRQCDEGHDGLFPFDVSHIETQVLNGQSLADVTVSYFDGNNNPLPNPLPNPFFTSSQTITIRVSNNRVADGSCYGETTLEFIVDAQPIAYSVPDLTACDDGPDDTDGIHAFDTSLIEYTLLNGQTGMYVRYFAEDGRELPSPLPNPFNTSSQTITAYVVNPLNNICYASTAFDFVVNPLPAFSIDTPQIVCSSNPSFPVVLDPMETNTWETFDYEWVYEDGTVLSKEPTLTVSIPGTYSITLTKTDGTGCHRTREIFVNASELATITLEDITIEDNSDSNSITINTAHLGLGDYEFALGDEFSMFQDSPYFNNVKSGIHTLYVRDKKGCGTTSIEISVIGYPKFFTPNGDGINDYWHINGTNNVFQSNSNILIFDRYGKLLKQLTATSLGWDGTFNGQMMPTDDYWFSVLLENGREFKGHFTLKR
jgi:gliding motility-associated-like protein